MAFTGSESRGRVLIVEDELLIGLDLQATIEQAGFGVIGPVPSIRKAMEAIEKDRERAENVRRLAICEGVEGAMRESG